ncbi:AraC family transcriptional regulator [Methylocystis heyeri]|uniref:Helix-turn-helix domain-containing protein n=1 Tax=Methylocystis heyeri TaxID=391905 RepID=A0A6B8KBI0_9HYPH|nr:AraC family transcriptional regulator [Methylocystis heyeri]QGM44912.1 helix-turn-helix domain-containing protein [Methylocystis heyeri]
MPSDATAPEAFLDKLNRTLALCDAHSGTGAEGGLHRVGVACFAPQVLTDLGVDPSRTAKAAGLDPDILSNPENLISFVELGRYMEKCVEHSNCSYFGLLVGERGSLAALGLMGQFMRHAPSLGDALQDLATHHMRYIRGATVFLYRTRSDARWGYAVYQRGAPGREQICAAAIAVATRIAKELNPSCEFEVLLSQAPPQTAMQRAQYECRFGARVHFNSECSALAISREELAWPIDGSDPSERERLSLLIEDYWLKTPPNLCHLVFRTLVSMVPNSDLSLSRVSRCLSMHPRTLERRLEEAGTSFLILREAARYEMARQLLIGTHLRLVDISAAIGYADPAVFSRSFRRWTGVSPKKFRSKQFGIS